MRSPYGSLLCLAAVVLSFPSLVQAQDRRGRSTPGIVLETGARLGSCDVLTFAPDGNELLAVGDDKVVRTWKVGANAIDAESSRALRWPIYREQVGAIYSLALSPDGKHVAIGGHGIRVGLVSILDRATGNVHRVMQRRYPESYAVTTFLRYSPDGKYLFQGTANGEIYRWEPSDNRNVAVLYQSKPEQDNRIRLIAFLKDGKRFVVVTQKSKITLHDLDRGANATPQVIRSFPDETYRAELSPDNRWLALIRMNARDTSGDNGIVDLVDLKTGNHQTIEMPSSKTAARRPSALAFDAKSGMIAIGMQEVSRLRGIDEFARETSGLVHVWDLSTGVPRRRSKSGFSIGYNVDAVSFRPGREQLAVAGGPNHEVRLFALRQESSPLSTIRSPGSCLWSVAMSKDGRYLAWRERHNPSPTHPNDRGIGDWRHFPLKPPADGKARRILSEVPDDVEFVQPITTLDGWTVVPKGGFFWSVQHQNGYEIELNEKNRLYFRTVNQIPQCYTFISTKGKPPRLAIGHTWGISIYELRDRQVTLARVLLGHQGAVMSVAPSADGELLVSTGRDQTIACWSLKDWPSSPELGARFVEQNGQVIVDQVDPGSPAWEAGLSIGERLEVVGIIQPDSTAAEVYDSGGHLRYFIENGRTVAQGEYVQDGVKGTWKFDPVRRRSTAQQIIQSLHNARTNRYHYFGKLDAKGNVEGQMTSLRQRPLWVFFPTRAEEGSNWLFWRWRDYLFDSDQQRTDRLAGFQRTRDVDETPEFYRLDRFAKRYYNPNKLWKYVGNVFAKDIDVTKVLFADVEPPLITTKLIQEPNDPNNPKIVRDLILEVTLQPKQLDSQGKIPDPQKISRLSLWLDDYLHDLGDKLPAADPKTGAVTKKFELSPSQLRRGVNRLRVVGYNVAGGATEAVIEIPFEDLTRLKRRLLALSVGVSDYSEVRRRSKNNRITDLPCARNDATILNDVFRQHKDSELFGEVHVAKPLIDRSATRKDVLAELNRLSQLAQPDDWLVLYLSGHGTTLRDDDSLIQAGTFYFACYDTEYGKPETGIPGKLLHDLLRQVNCHKLILFDACQSGDAIDDPVRNLTQGEANFLIFTACQPDEAALEPNRAEFNKQVQSNPEQYANLQVINLDHGFFTLGILNALGHPMKMKGLPRVRPITAETIRKTIRSTVQITLRDIGTNKTQTPTFYPDDEKQLRRLAIFCLPDRQRKKK